MTHRFILPNLRASGRSIRHRDDLKRLLQSAFAANRAFASKLGLDPGLDFEIQELRRALRTGPDGNTIPQIIGAITQSRVIDEREQTCFMGRVTIVVDLLQAVVKYRIVKPVAPCSLRRIKQNRLPCCIHSLDQQDFECAAGQIPS